MESASPPSPKNDDTDVAVYLKLAATVLYYIVYPVYWLGYILFVLLQQILSPIWSVVSFVALPLTYLVAFVVHLLSLPFKLMAKLETVYIFFGIAVLIGLSAGLMLAVLSSLTTSTLQLDTKSPKSPPRRLRTLSAFRAARVNRKHVDSPVTPLTARNLSATSTATPLSPLSPRAAGATKAEDYLTSTILEEDDSG